MHILIDVIEDTIESIENAIVDPQYGFSDDTIFQMMEAVYHLKQSRRYILAITPLLSNDITEEEFIKKIRMKDNERKFGPNV